MTTNITNTEKNNLISIFLLFFLIIVLLVISEQYFCDENYFNQYNPVYYTICKSNGNQNPFVSFDLWNESGFIENLQALFLFLSIIFIFITIKAYRKNIFFKILLIIKLFALIYFLGEEISWGQHFLEWNSPEFFMIANSQKETNLHNISGLFNQFPRLLVLIWCALSSITIFLINRISMINNQIFIFICPDKKLIYISILLLLCVIPDLVVDKFNLYKESIDGDFSYNKKKFFYGIISLKFLRLSELQELIFTFYFFIYSVSLKKRFKNIT